MKKSYAHDGHALSTSISRIKASVAHHPEVLKNELGIDSDHMIHAWFIMLEELIHLWTVRAIKYPYSKRVHSAIKLVRQDMRDLRLNYTEAVQVVIDFRRESTKQRQLQQGGGGAGGRGGPGGPRQGGRGGSPDGGGGGGGQNGGRGGPPGGMGRNGGRGGPPRGMGQNGGRGGPPGEMGRNGGRGGPPGGMGRNGGRGGPPGGMGQNGGRGGPPGRGGGGPPNGGQGQQDGGMGPGRGRPPPVSGGGQPNRPQQRGRGPGERRNRRGPPRQGSRDGQPRGRPGASQGQQQQFNSGDMAPGELPGQVRTQASPSEGPQPPGENADKMLRDRIINRDQLFGQNLKATNDLEDTKLIKEKRIAESIRQSLQTGEVNNHAHALNVISEEGAEEGDEDDDDMDMLF